MYFFLFLHTSRIVYNWKSRRNSIIDNLEITNNDLLIKTNVYLALYVGRFSFTFSFAKNSFVKKDLVKFYLYLYKKNIT